METQIKLGAHAYESGVSFGVWAPFAEHVAVTGSCNSWGRTDMQRDDQGNWFIDIAGAEAGGEYKFAITYKGEEFLKNDPRARQLTTDAGNSVIVEPNFDWGAETYTPLTLDQHIIYELHVGTFGRPDDSTPGTFDDIIEKLDYLAELGITAIELMPICSMYQDRGWGYASDYIYAVESMYGGPRGLRELVKAAHGRGIGIVVDVVYNHLGPNNNIDIWRFDGWHEGEGGGIYFYNDERRRTPWGDTRPDYGRPEVRQYITDNVQMWLEDYHIDGLRIDSTIYIRNLEGRNNYPQQDLADGWKLLQAINAAAQSVRPGALIIAEDSSGNEYITRPVQDGGAGFATQWEVGFPSILRTVLVPARDEDRTLHELSLQLGKSYNGNPLERVLYADSHDSAANGGRRLASDINPEDPNNIYALKRSLLATAIVLTAPGIPMLFQGQEFAQPGSFDDWHGLDWKLSTKHKGLVDACRHLVDLRKNRYDNTAGLSGGEYTELVCDDTRKLLAYQRGDTIAVLNVSSRSITDYKIPMLQTGTWTIRFNSDWHGYHEQCSNIGSITADGIDIGPYSMILLSQDTNHAT